MDIRLTALRWLQHCDALEKAQGVRALDLTGLTLDPHASLAATAPLPGRPQRPELLPHTEIRHGSIRTDAGKASLMHAVAHIEFNAINLALDAVWRFDGMPEAYYRDWMRVAQEEAHHFGLVVAYLGTLGHRYGDFPAHQGLWDMVERTREDITARMALVPRTLEARGLDASPPMRAKLEAAGDLAASEILGVILRDEIGHVAVGNYWYRWLCDREGHDPEQLYPQLLTRYQAPRLRPPYNLQARRAAGFTEEELARMHDLHAPSYSGEGAGREVQDQK